MASSCVHLACLGPFPTHRIIPGGAAMESMLAALSTSVQPKTRPLKQRPCFTIMAVGECTLLCSLEPRLGQQRRQPAAFAQLAALCPHAHDKLPPGFNWFVIGSLLPPLRLLQQGPLSAHLSRCLPPVALPLACPASASNALSALRTACVVQGPCAPQYSMTGVSRIGARRTKLWYASL